MTVGGDARLAAGDSAADARRAPDAHERRISRRLEARGLPGLGASLIKLDGVVVAGRWRLDELYAVGAEGAVYTATDLANPKSRVVVKTPLVPYHRPAELSSSVLRHRRDALREEAKNLAKSASPYMPANHGLFEFENPLLDRRRGGAFEEPDPALVMERLGGLDVDLWLGRVHRSGMPRMVLRPHLDRIAVVMLNALHDLHERGYFYADLRPGNLRVVGRPLRSVRLLDAGSLVEVGDESGRFPHVPHYLPPELFERRYVRDVAIAPSAAVQAVMAGRTLYEVATGCVPVPGRPLQGAELRDTSMSPLLADVVDGLATGSFSGVAAALKYLQRRKPTPAPAPAAAPAARPVVASAPKSAPAAAAKPAAAATPTPASAPRKVEWATPTPTPAPRPAPASAPARPAPKPVVAAPAPKPRKRSWWRRLLGLGPARR